MKICTNLQTVVRDKVWKSLKSTAIEAVCIDHDEVSERAKIIDRNWWEGEEVEILGNLDREFKELSIKEREKIQSWEISEIKVRAELTDELLDHTKWLILEPEIISSAQEWQIAIASQSDLRLRLSPDERKAIDTYGNILKIAHSIILNGCKPCMIRLVNLFSHGRLRLRWDDGDKRQTLAIGVNDTPVGRSLAQKKKQEIEHDWLISQYDRTLLKYRPRTIGKTATEILAPELFRLFGEHQAKYKGVSRSSIESRYKPIVRMLEKYLNKPAHTIGKRQVDNFVAISQETISGRTAKERCWLIQSCWDWAKDKYHLAPDNPWVDAAVRFQILPRQQVKPFTIAELQAIRSAISSHPQYRYYSDFISFLTNTGVRFGEAAGLRWKHLGADYTTAWIGESISRGHHNLKTKTGKARTIQIPPTLQAVLVLRYQQLQPKPDDLVFPAPRGGAIDDNRFRARCWKTIYC